MSSPLVSRKRNWEYGPAGARIVLLDQAQDKVGMVENSTELPFQEGPSMDRVWSQGRVPKGSSLCAETFDAEIRRPTRCGFRDFYLRVVISDCLLIGFIRATETLQKELKQAIRDCN